MTNTDRFLISLFIIIGVITVIVFFSRRVVIGPQAASVRGTTYNYQVVAPARAGTVVRAISPVQTTRSSNVIDSRSYYTYTTVPQQSSTTTYYESY